jgi:hypothetical protein
VGVVDGPGQCFEQLGRLLRGQRGGLQLLGQAAALDQLHDQERPALMLAGQVDLHDVGVLEAGDDLGLGAEAGAILLPGRVAQEEDLDGHRPVQALLPRQEDQPHAAPAQHPFEPVAGDRPPRPALPRDGGAGGERSLAGRHLLDHAGDRVEGVVHLDLEPQLLDQVREPSPVLFRRGALAQLAAQTEFVVEEIDGVLGIVGARAKEL